MPTNTTDVTTSTLAPVTAWSPFHCMFHTSSSLAAIYIIGSLVAFIFGSVLTWCIMYRTGVFSTSKDEKNQLFSIIQTYLWDCEDKIDIFLCTLEKLNTKVLNGKTTELHLFAYNMRHSVGAFQRRFSISERFDEANVQTAQNHLFIVKHIERFIEAILLHIPSRRKAHKQIQITIGPYIRKLFYTTALLWDEKKISKVRRVLHYFMSNKEILELEHYYVSDKNLDCMITNYIPYHNRLGFTKNTFILQHIELLPNDSVNIGSKMRFVDTFLAHGYISQDKMKSVTDWLKEAKDICSTYDLLPNESAAYINFNSNIDPTVITFNEKIVALRHLFRMMCMDKNIKKLEKEDRFFQFLMHLYEPMYGWADLRFKSEVLERTRGDIFVCLKMLDPDLMLSDKEASRSKLDKVERELCGLLAYLTLKRDQSSQMCAYGDKCGSKDLLREDSKNLNEGSRSIQTGTNSHDSLLDHESQPLLSRGRIMRSADNLASSPLEILHQQSSFQSDQVSWVSGSSMYATAPSISSAECTSRMSPQVNIAAMRRQFLRQDVPIQVEPYDETAV